ncbi:Hypothetical protein PHPALM_17926 [Phytophthora palmivora]|uniref:Uncharacterized protein n=1 Tax=Phytophthora palmivora TaxID=4796 RepID=A0A2P4XL45_9STRA|nr:Hypothetical protein PHPALM_17926 [Phytophthora palmivora]
MITTDAKDTTPSNYRDLVLSPSATLVDVHTAWLAAGARSDVGVMRQLMSQFPEWLDLQRVRSNCVSRLKLFCFGPSDSTLHHTHFCSWDGFHLHTIGASTLHTAAWNGDVVVMKLLLEYGQHPDSSDDNGLTPMMVVILQLNLVTTRCVFRNGEAIRRNLVVDCREEEGEQLKQATAVIELLLRFGATVDVRSQDGKTALHCSTSDDAYEVAKLLLDAGADANIQDEIGRTALHYCIQEGGLVVADLLLSRGACVDVADTNGITPIDLMLQRRDLNVLQILLNHHQCVSTLQRQNFACSILLQAVDVEAEEVIRFVVNNGYAPVTVCNAKGETAMHRAILQHSPSVMELLSDLDMEGDTLAAMTLQLETPAHYAAVYGSAREVETLLLCLTRAFGDLEELEDLGVTNPLNAVDERGMTCLYIVGISASGTENGFGDNNISILEDRNAKAQLLLNHGGRLFADGFLVQTLTMGQHRLTLPAQVQRCLQVWLTERLNQTDFEGLVLIGGERSTVESLVELCIQWIACATGLGTSLTLIAVVTCAGYAHELLPLLLDLPLRRQKIPTLLHQLQTFATHQNSALLIQFHAEMRSAWYALTSIPDSPH